MSSGFKVDGFFIPNFYDTNKDKNLSVNEINIFCADNTLEYNEETQKITVATDDYSQNDLKLEPEKYSIENLKRRYPSDKYSINESCGSITVVDKNTDITLLRIIKDSNGTYIEMRDEKGRSVYFRNYDKNGTLLFYNKGNECHCPIADNIYEAVSAKKAKMIPTTDVKKLILNVMRITPVNYFIIIYHYERKYGQTLLDAINNEWGLEDNVKNKLLEHLNKCAAEVLNSAKYGVNCKIDGDFYQGDIGDCWFLSSIAAVKRSPKGQEILNNMITDNKDGTYTVKFKGADKEYTVNACEIFDKRIYASGDLDVRILEIAAEKHFNILGIEDGGNSATALELLLGTGDKWKNIGRAFSQKSSHEKIKELLSNPNIAMTASTDRFSKLWGLIVKDIPEEADYKSDVASAHCYAIVGIDDENIHIQNPWYTNRIIKIPLDVFEEYWDCVQYTEIA